MSQLSYPAAAGLVNTSAVTPPALTRTYTPRRRAKNRLQTKNRLQNAVEERMAQRAQAAAERWKAIALGTVTTEHSHWVIARLNEIQHLGTLDRLGGIGYLYSGPVGTAEAQEGMHAQIHEHAGDICIVFWPADGRARRLLVTARGDAYVEVWTKTGPSAIKHSGKYLTAWKKLSQVRVTSCPSPVTSRQQNGEAF